ncbi:predicted protein [Botrytis cinerea T4]|uniref:Uncharacterized protein n=1 Tax=Botryotinia fuckeliana (strain T4) TaxID=999810 RepID=G2YNS1_BOTF4|nr:predicted protein [Botrytis cinerea T4]
MNNKNLNKLQMINESRNVGIKEIRGDSRMGDIPVTNHFPTIQNSLPGPPSIKSNKE